MKRLFLIAAMLVFSLAMPAQQQAPPTPDSQQVPGQTPPTFPEDTKPSEPTTPRDMPPDTQAPSPRELSSPEIRDQIQTKLDSEPGLENHRLRVEVSDSEVTVSGTVDDEAERDLALRIAESYAGDRSVVDKVQIKGKA
ncbi:MAG: BON domain-containing protein [Acidobacteriales bacterium]|nr:BON domain-containing protein [Terriglobales bacterium]